MAYPLINARFILLTSASFIAIFSSIAIYFCLPILISHMIRTQITLSTSSGSYNNWRLNSVIDRIYLYNITNLSDLPSESSSSNVEDRTRPRPIPKLQQIGPFAFRQDREKLNIRFDTTNETVIYDQKRTWTFLPELSQMKSVEEMRAASINHVSVPLAGTTMTPEYGEIIDSIVAEQGLRLFLNHSVDTLLFQGYFDILMEQGKANGQIDVDRFGWMHNQNNTIQKSIRVFTGPSNATLNRFGGVDEYSYMREFSVWHNNNTDPSNFKDVKCNQFRLSSAGEFFPPPEYSIIGHNNYYQYTQHQQRLKQQQQEQEDLNNSSNNKKQQSVNVSDPSSVSPNPIMDGEQATSRDTDKSIQAATLGPKLSLDTTKAGKSISLFMPELCRSIKLFYIGSYDFKNLLLVDRYIANEQTFMYSTNGPTASGGTSSDATLASNESLIESNNCFCNYNETTQQTSCPPNGMMDLNPCRKGSPVGISFPHFLYSSKDTSLEPYLKLYSDDVEANEDEHGFFMDLETTLNIPVNVQIVLQFNVRLRNDRAMHWTDEYSYLTEDLSNGQNSSKSQQPKDFYLPQMWIKSTAGVDDTNLAHLRFIQKHLDLVTPITTIIIFGFASILLLASAKLAYDLTYGPNSTRKSSSCDHESCSSLNGAHSCSYLDEKKKYLNMQEKSFKFASSMGNLTQGKVNKHHQFGNKSNEYNNQQLSSLDDLHRPTTSKKANNSIVIPCQVPLGSHDCESEPLNR